MARYDFRVDGIPKGQPRARAFSRGGKAGVFDPGTADAWKHAVAMAGRALRPSSPIASGVGVTVQVDCFLPRPKRLMRAKDTSDVIPHVGKPDADNLAKAVLDALTADGWWADDAQVFALIVRKWYHRKDGRPGATITIQDSTPIPFGC